MSMACTTVFGSFYKGSEISVGFFCDILVIARGVEICYLAEIYFVVNVIKVDSDVRFVSA